MIKNSWSDVDADFHPGRKTLRRHSSYVSSVLVQSRLIFLNSLASRIGQAKRGRRWWCKMYENASPFDEALSRPFLDEQPVKKRWSLFTQSSACSSEDDAQTPRAGANSSRYSAPMEEIVFQSQKEASDNNDDEEEEGLFVLANAVEEGTVVDANLAIMRERHDDISHIHSEMQQLNEIQRGEPL